jgi:hypothetical protein
LRIPGRERQQPANLRPVDALLVDLGHRERLGGLGNVAHTGIVAT